MPPRRLSSFDYRDMRTRPSGTYYAEIRTGAHHVSLGMYKTVQETAHAYDAAAWTAAPNVWNREKVQERAPPPRLVSCEDRLLYRQQHRPAPHRRDERARHGDVAGVLDYVYVLD